MPNTPNMPDDPEDAQLPLTVYDLYELHEAIGQAIAGRLKAPEGVSPVDWGEAVHLAIPLGELLCHILGHGSDNRVTRAMAVIMAAFSRTRAARKLNLLRGSLESMPWLYRQVQLARGSCPECGVAHDPQMPHEWSSMFYHSMVLARTCRRPTLGDSIAHCHEHIQKLFMSLWQRAEFWPAPVQGCVIPEWYAAEFDKTIRAAGAWLLASGRKNPTGS